jgi:hypothetical protein
LRYDTRMCVRCADVCHVDDCREWRRCTLCSESVCMLCVEGIGPVDIICQNCTEK